MHGGLAFDLHPTIGGKDSGARWKGKRRDTEEEPGI